MDNSKYPDKNTVEWPHTNSRYIAEEGRLNVVYRDSLLLDASDELISEGQYEQYIIAKHEADKKYKEFCNTALVRIYDDIGECIYEKKPAKYPHKDTVEWPHTKSEYAAKEDKLNIVYQGSLLSNPNEYMSAGQFSLYSIAFDKAIKTYKEHNRSACVYMYDDKGECIFQKGDPC